jgi:hypothetical protein
MLKMIRDLIHTPGGVHPDDFVADLTEGLNGLAETQRRGEAE